MNFIQQLVEKYNGEYSSELTKTFYSPMGKLTYQPKQGTIVVDETKIKISFKEAGGAMRNTEPIRIVLFLDKNYSKRLSIYPSLNLNYITDLFLQPKGLVIPKLLKRQFSFRGDSELLKNLVKDQIFCETLLNEEFYLTLNDRFPKSLMLTPANGIYDIEHFEKIIVLLKTTESYIKCNFT